MGINSALAGLTIIRLRLEIAIIRMRINVKLLLIRPMLSIRIL